MEEPPYLTVGTDVSAKYKGAFCEAKITDVNKHVKLRVLFDGSSGSYLIDDVDLKAGSVLEAGTRIEAKHPEKKQPTYVQATITKILDHSRYTVVFDDGDQCVLRRNFICLKSGKHFAESETLDRLPLTNPEHFGNPVKVGLVDQTTSNQNSGSTTTTNSNAKHNDCSANNQQTNHQQATANDGNNNSNHGAGNASNNNSNQRAPNSPASASNSSKTPNVKHEAEKQRAKTPSNATTVASGRRGLKGRRRRESSNHGSKSVHDSDDDFQDNTPESNETDLGSNVKYELIEIGVKLMVEYGKGKIKNVYEAKVNKIETNNSGKTRYFVHYTGWNNRYDEWITRNRILSVVTDRENSSRDGRTKQSDAALTPVTSAPAATSATTANNSTSASNASTTKEKDTITTKTRRSRQSEVNTTTPLATTTTTTSTTTTVVAAAASTPAKDKEQVSKTRRSRQVESSTPQSTTTTSTSTTWPTNTPTARERERDKDREPPAKMRRVRHIETSASSSAAAPATTSPNAATTTQSSSKIMHSTTSNNTAVAPTTAVKREPQPCAANDTRTPPESASTKSSPPSTEQNSLQTTKTVPNNSTTKDEDCKDTPTTKTRRSAKASRTKDLKAVVSQANHQNSSAQIIPNLSDEDNRKLTVSSKSTNSGSSSAGSADDSSQDNNLQQSVRSNKRNASKNDTKITGSPRSKAGEMEAASRVLASISKEIVPPTNTDNLNTLSAAAESSSPLVTDSTTASTALETVASEDSNAPSKADVSDGTAAGSKTEEAICKKAIPQVPVVDSITPRASEDLPALSDYRSSYRFCDDIDEPNCDKKISILQERIMALRETYMSLKNELADLDRRRKRPRTERVNSDQINGLVCRN